MHIIAPPAAADVLRLLATCSLPTADLAPHHFQHFLGIVESGALIGVVGLEIFGEVALLRSLAVDAEKRGCGLGGILVDRAEERAQAAGVRELYLLTTTAESFFLHRGYERFDRDQAPEAIRTTSEFSHLCPASSVLMRRILPQGRGNRE